MAHLHCDSHQHCRAELKTVVTNTFLSVKVSQNCEEDCTNRRRTRALSDVCPHEWDNLEGGVEHPCVCNDRAVDFLPKALNDLSAFQVDADCECTTTAGSETSGHSHSSEDSGAVHAHGGHGDAEHAHGHVCGHGCDHGHGHAADHGHGHGEGHGHSHSHSHEAVEAPTLHPSGALAGLADQKPGKRQDVSTIVRQTFVEVEVRGGCVKRVCPRRRRGRSYSDPCPPIPSPLDDQARPCTCNDRLEEDCDCTEADDCALSCVAAPDVLQHCGASKDPIQLPAPQLVTPVPAGPPGSFPPGCFQAPPGLFAGASVKAESSSKRAAKAAAEEACSAAFDDPGTRTTLIFKNLPPGCSREELMRVLDSKGFAGQYDFMYLPVSITTGGSYGYAFVNFLTPNAAGRAARELLGFDQWSGGLGKNALRTLWSEIQGRDEYVEKYRNSPVMHRKVPDEYRPVVLDGGKVVPFPEPTKGVKAPRFRDRR